MSVKKLLYKTCSENEREPSTYLAICYFLVVSAQILLFFYCTKLTILEN